MCVLPTPGCRYHGPYHDVNDCQQSCCCYFQVDEQQLSQDCDSNFFFYKSIRKFTFYYTAEENGHMLAVHLFSIANKWLQLDG